MFRIAQAALDWYTGKVKDGGTEACRTCPGKAAIFAAIAEARAAHLTHHVLPAVPC